MVSDEVYLGLDESKADEKKAIEVWDKNEQAYSYLLLSVTGVPFNLVEGSKTEKSPEGDAKLAWDNLLKKYEPKEITALVDEETEFADCQMNSCEDDPDTCMMQFDRHRRRLKKLGTAYDNIKMISHILGRLPEQYSELVTLVEQAIRIYPNYKLDTLQSSIRIFYEQKFKGQRRNPSNTALNTRSTGGNFKSSYNR